jgi:hypothetical protein
VNKQWHSEIEDSAAVAVAEALVDHAKCIRQLVQIVVRNVKFRSNQLKADQSTAGNVIQNIENINPRDYVIECFRLAIRN